MIVEYKTAAILVTNDGRVCKFKCEYMIEGFDIGKMENVHHYFRIKFKN